MRPKQEYHRRPKARPRRLLVGGKPGDLGRAGGRAVGWLGILLAFVGNAYGATATEAREACLAADIVEDGVVDSLDLAEIDALLGQIDSRGDLDGSGVVDSADRRIVFAWVERCPVGCPEDLSRDGWIDVVDRQLLEADYETDCRADLNRDGRICPLDACVLKAYYGSPTPLSLAALRANLKEKEEDEVEDVVDNGDLSRLEEEYPDTPVDPEEPIPWKDCRADLNRDGTVDELDLPRLLAAWGPCTVPPLEPDVWLRGENERTCDGPDYNNSTLDRFSIPKDCLRK